MTTLRRVPPARPLPAALLDPHELGIFATTHSNCLLIGSNALVEDALTALQPLFRHTPVFLSAQQPLELPSASLAATFVVRDVGDLTAPQQAALSSWMDCAPARVQVVSTTPAAIWPAVEAR